MANVGTLSIAKLLTDTEYGKAHTTYWDDYFRQSPGGFNILYCKDDLVSNFDKFDQNNSRLEKVIQELTADKKLDIVLITERVRILWEELAPQKKIVIETFSVQDEMILWLSQENDITAEVSNKLMANL